MSGTTARTPSEARATRRVDVARLLKSSPLSASMLAEQTGASETKAGQWIDERRDSHIGVADAAGIECADTRRALAEYVMGDGYVVVALPEAAAIADDMEHAALVASECGDVVSAHVRALADRTLTRAEAVDLQREVREAIRALVSLDARLDVPVREGVDGLRVVAGGGR